MQKWEYLVSWIFEGAADTSNDPVGDFLNSYGDQGWEVVTVHYHSDKKTAVVMKRPKGK